MGLVSFLPVIPTPGDPPGHMLSKHKSKAILRHDGRENVCGDVQAGAFSDTLAVPESYVVAILPID